MLGSDVVVFGKGLGHKDVIKHLDDPDASLVRFFSQQTVHLHVALIDLFGDFQGIRIILQFDQGSEGVTVPQVEGVHTVGNQEVQELDPLVLVIEKGEVFGCVRILIGFTARQNRRQLHPNAGAAQPKCRPFGNIQHSGPLAGFFDPVNQLQSPIEGSGIAVPLDAVGAFGVPIKMKALGGTVAFNPVQFVTAEDNAGGAKGTEIFPQPLRSVSQPGCSLPPDFNGQAGRSFPAAGTLFFGREGRCETHDKTKRYNAEHLFHGKSVSHD